MSEECSRRDVMKTATTAGLASAAVALLATEEVAANAQFPNDELARERAIIQRCGLTAQEANSWVLIARLASDMLKIPGFTQEDHQQITQAIQLLQNKLLSQPTKRRYSQLTGN